MYYTLNTNYSNDNKKEGTNVIYNFCQQVEYYCINNHNVINGSLVKISNLGCFAYTQSSIDLLDLANISKGLSVSYKLATNNSISGV